jgi:hypothetical protein
MSALLDELKNFNRFAESKLEQPGYESLEELLGLWRANHPVARSPADTKHKPEQPSDAKRPAAPGGKGKIPYLNG